MTSRRLPPRRRRTRPEQAAFSPASHATAARSRWSRRLALAAALALLGPGLAIGALLHVNDILSADLLPGTLFLREGPGPDNTTLPLGAIDGHLEDKEAAGRPRAGNWTDAFLTMNFHRKMMNEYLCRSYVAEQILGDMVEPASAALTAEPPRRRISSTLVVTKRKHGEHQDDEHSDDDSRDQDAVSQEDGVDQDDPEDPSRRSAGNGTESPRSPSPRAPPAEAPEDNPQGADAPASRRRQAMEARGNFPTFRRKPSSATTPTADPKRRLRRRRRRRRKKRPSGGYRRADPLNAKENMLADEGSSAYKDWLARTTLLEDIYRHYDHIAQASEQSASDDTTTFEGGEVTGFALTHSAVAPNPGLGQALNPGLGQALSPGLGQVLNPGLSPALNAASFKLPVQQHPTQHISLHPGLNLATSINSFAAPVPGGLGNGLGNGLGSSLGPGFGSGLGPGPGLGSNPGFGSSLGGNGGLSNVPGPGAGPPGLGVGGVGEDRNPFEFSGGGGGGGGEYLDEHPEHHSHHEHQEYEYEDHMDKGHGKMLSLKDLFDLVLTAIAFLAFGAFAVHLIMCLMMMPQQPPMYPMMEMPPPGTGGGNDNGAGEGEGGRRRRRRAAPKVSPGAATPMMPTVSVEVLNRAAQRVLASIDAAMLVYQPATGRRGRSSSGDARDGGQDGVQDDDKELADHRDCLHRALCRHNRFSRTVQGPFGLWMPIWSVGMSWMAGRLAPGESSPAVATLDNLRASLLGLGNARCHVVYTRCSSRTSTTTTTTTTTTKTTTPITTTTTTTTTTASPPQRAPLPPGIIHPAFSDLPKIITMRPTGAVAPHRVGDDGSLFTAIGVKTNKNKKKRRRRPAAHASRPHASAREAPRPQPPAAGLGAPP